MTTVNMTYLERMVTALAFAAPWALGVRYQDLARCVEACVGGAGALKRRRIDARALPCAVVAFNPNIAENGFVHALGHTAQSAYAWFREHAGGSPPSFEEWSATCSFPNDSLHLVIEAKFRGQRALVDLTIGQIREASGGRIVVPNAMTYYGDDWPSFDLGAGAFLSYQSTPKQETSRHPWRDYKCPGLIADIDDLMGVALTCNLDRDRYAAEMHRLARDFKYD